MGIEESAQSKSDDLRSVIIRLGKKQTYMFILYRYFKKNHFFSINFESIVLYFSTILIHLYSYFDRDYVVC